MRRLWPMLLGVSFGTWGAAGLMTGAYARHGAIALGVFAAVGGLWPWMLHAHSPDLFRVWLWDNNFARFLGGNNLGPTNERWTTHQKEPINTAQTAMRKMTILIKST